MLVVKVTLPVYTVARKNIRTSLSFNETYFYQVANFILVVSNFCRHVKVLLAKDTCLIREMKGKFLGT